jgi:hypothetical protein
MRGGRGTQSNVGGIMSVSPASEQPAQVRGAGVQASSDYYRDDERGYGWVMFAGVLLLMLGTLNFIEGLAAVGNAHFFTANANYIAGSLNTWGWVVLCIGVLEWAVGCGVFIKNQFSRWVGVVVLAGNAIVQLMMIPAYPFWSLSIFTLDILAIYGLIAHGKRIAES